LAAGGACDAADHLCSFVEDEAFFGKVSRPGSSMLPSGAHPQLEVPLRGQNLVTSFL
jgi:hypothetical protein